MVSKHIVSRTLKSKGSVGVLVVSPSDGKESLPYDEKITHGDEAKMIFEFLHEMFCMLTLEELKKIIPLREEKI